MGTTDNYALPYPEGVEFVKDGAAAIQALAEAVDVVEDAADTPPMINLVGTDDDLDGDGRPIWDTDHPTRISGTWTFGPSDHLIKPPSPGLYLVILGYTLKTAGGVSGGGDVTFRARVQTMVQGGDTDTDANTWMTWRSNLTDQDDDTQRCNLAALVYVDTTPNRGIQVTVTSPELAPPGVAGDDGGRLQIIRLGTLPA